MKKRFHDYSSLLTHDERVERGKKGAIASGSKPYSDFETSYLIQNYGVISLKQIALDLNRTYYSVVDKRKKLGLKFDSRSYSQEEDQFIREHCLKLTQYEVAKSLNRSRESVAARAIRLGVRFIKVGDASPLTIHPQEDVEMMRELRELGLTYSDIADKFELHPAYVRQLCSFERRLYDSTDFYHQMLDRQKDAIHGLT
ncbi:TPA: DNA-binding protein [Vibrio parahaemolyticus]